MVHTPMHGMEEHSVKLNVNNMEKNKNKHKSETL